MSELLVAYSWLSFASLPGDSAGRFWLAFGLCGNVCFFTRFLVQWIYSERAKESRIPVVFWWQSIFGSLILLAYFVHREDPVGVLGYVVNVVPYTRNLVLVYRKRRSELSGFPIVAQHASVSDSPHAGGSAPGAAVGATDASR